MEIFANNGWNSSNKKSDLSIIISLHLLKIRARSVCNNGHPYLEVHFVIVDSYMHQSLFLKKILIRHFAVKGKNIPI
jgi:hypothetical protein